MLDVRGTPTAYLLRNSRYNVEYEQVRPRVVDIAAKSVASLIRTQGIGDTYRIAIMARGDGVAVKLTWIPAVAVRDPGEQMFDSRYMSSLFDYGYQRAINDSAWMDIDLDELRALEID
jgi:hypothetical protein